MGGGPSEMRRTILQGMADGGWWGGGGGGGGDGKKMRMGAW